MLSFKEFYLTEAAGNVEKLTHLQHLEEFLYHGANSIRDAINTLRDARDVLAGHGKGGYIKNITTKIDGCIHGDTLIVTSDGPIKISELTNKHEVKCYEINTGEYHYYNNTTPHTTGANKTWVEVVLENGEAFICTEDHPVLTSTGDYVEAIDLVGKAVVSNEI